MPDPEALARLTIDRLLTDAGWTVVDRDQVNPFALVSLVSRFPRRTIGIVGMKVCTFQPHSPIAKSG